MLETAPKPKALSETFPVPTWRARLTDLLDHVLVQLVFGVGLPLFYVFAVWQVVRWNTRKEWLEPHGPHAFALIAALAACMAAWSMFAPRGRFLARFFAVAFSFGAALAVPYALFLWRGAASSVLEIPWDPAETGPVVVIAGLVLLLALIASVTTAVFARQAVRAWSISGTWIQHHPSKTVAITVAGIYLFCAGLVLTSIQLRNRAFTSLRTGRPEAVDEAMQPLRMAAFLRGEDWLVHDLSWEPEEKSFRHEFDEAFFRLTGKTASDRASELRARD
jgi:hypothetical protein